MDAQDRQDGNLSCNSLTGAINYLATRITVGLGINFGSPKLDYRRFTRSK